MAGIFISYRQADAKAWAIGLRDDLANTFGDDQVFLDKDTLHAGNWRAQIERALDRCNVVLIVIGPRWLTIADEHHRPRLSLPDDVHRQEVALALSHQETTVIPVLVDDAAMPRAEQLPEDLRGLCDQQAYKVGDTKARRKADLEVLVHSIQAVGGLTPRRGVIAAEKKDTSEEQFSWYSVDFAALGISIVLTLGSAMYAYRSTELGGGEIVFLLVLFYALAIAGKWLWRLLVERRRKVA
jgi:hypothetical protein